MTAKTVRLAWYYEATVAGTDEQAATFVLFPWPMPNDGSRPDPRATAKRFGTELRCALHAGATREEVAVFVAEALFDSAPLTAMIERFDERIERGPASHAAVVQELIDRATAELNLARDNARRFAEELIDEPPFPGEHLPLEGASLSQLLGLAPDRATAVLGAWTANPDNPPLLFIASATATVIFGAASGLTSALNTGLRARILAWNDLPDPLAGLP
jgi:hypothetical protein